MNDFIALLSEPLKEVYAHFARFFPNVLAMLIIIVSGIIVALIIRTVLLKLLKAIKFNSWSDRTGLTASMRKWNLWTDPAAAVVSFIFWILVIMVFMAGFSALNIPAIDNLVSQFVLYIPRIISATLILALGYVVTGFVGWAVVISAVNRGYHVARLFADGVRIFLIVLFIAMALEQLQVAPGIVVAAFSIIFGGIVAALAISFGVGGIDAARRMIERESAEKRAAETKDDIEHI